MQLLTSLQCKYNFVCFDLIAIIVIIIVTLITFSLLC